MSETARTAVRVAPGTTEMQELPLPAIDEDSALLQVEVAGICGTDVKMPDVGPARPSPLGPARQAGTGADPSGLRRLRHPGVRLADGGIPVHPHAGLTRTGAAGAQLARALGHSAAVLPRGHGVATVGGDVPQVVSRLALDELLGVSVELARLGATPLEVSEADREDLPDLGAAFSEQALWRHHLGRLELQGLADVG
ncbi:class II aldolase/adducin family protein [Streptomyces sp. NPDC047009]|uniref:class II aldolase/adducin family protein n=1 Tax=Streptomyces sp. NPDC047009 TaxID=3154496 RepID=UPI0034017C8C